MIAAIHEQAAARPFKVLCYAQNLEIGGTQVNAIEIASELQRRHNFDVTIYAVSGPMVELLTAKGLRYVEAPADYEARGKALQRLVVDERPDIVHVWDHWQAEHAFYHVSIPLRTPVLVTSMEMELPTGLPRSLPTTFGTVELFEQASARGFCSPHLLFPPVDVTNNAPGVVDPTGFLGRFQIASDDIVLVTVSRLVSRLKGESLYDTVEAMRCLGRQYPVRLLIVGEGAERSNLEEAAARANQEVGRQAIILVGPMVDPRPAYAAASIVIGMGGSALRGMAFGKPVIVVGAGGFARTMAPDTAEYFRRFGLYGCSQPGSGKGTLVAELETLLRGRERLAELAVFSRRFVEEYFALEVLVDDVARLCRDVCNSRVPAWRLVWDVVHLKGGVVSLAQRVMRRAVRRPS